MKKGERITVLDHGYVKLEDFMGRDEDIVIAARMSTGRRFEGWDPGFICRHCRIRQEERDPAVSAVCAGLDGLGGHVFEPFKGDAAMLEYLYENRHTTPFEMCELKIEVQAPILVFRQWHRHRTQCLAGDTEINLISPRGVTFKRTIRDIFTLKHGGVVDTAPTRHRNGYTEIGTPVTRAARRKHPWRVRVLPNCQTRVLRTFDEEAGEYRSGVMRDVWESGIKEIWELRTDIGTIRSSAEHPFLTKGGWAKLREIKPGELLATSGRVAARERPIPPSLRQGIGVWTSMMRRRLIRPEDTCHLCGGRFSFDDLDLDHVVPVCMDLKMALDETNLKPACKECHRNKINTEQPKRVGQCVLGLKWTRVLAAPTRVAEEMTYDLEMTDPDHNYVANGLVVHNSYNEMSARYIELPDLFYLPTIDRVCKQSTTNKQGSGTMFEEHEAEQFLHEMREEQKLVRRGYEEALRRGVAKELARLNQPVSCYSRMMAKGNLLNWLKFLSLRWDDHAQFEIREYGRVVAEIVAALWPRTFALYEEYTKHAVTFSRKETEVLRRFIGAVALQDGTMLSNATTNLGEARARKFLKKLGKE